MSPGLGEMISDAKPVTRDPNVCGGAPVLDGTRIRVSDIAVAYDHHELSPEEIVQEFPALEVQDIHSALAYYHSRPQEIRVEIQDRDGTLDTER